MEDRKDIMEGCYNQWKESILCLRLWIRKKVANFAPVFKVQKLEPQSMTRARLRRTSCEARASGTAWRFSRAVGSSSVSSRIRGAPAVNDASDWKHQDIRKQEPAIRFPYSIIAGFFSFSTTTQCVLLSTCLSALMLGLLHGKGFISFSSLNVWVFFYLIVKKKKKQLKETEEKIHLAEVFKVSACYLVSFSHLCPLWPYCTLVFNLWFSTEMHQRCWALRGPHFEMMAQHFTE